MSNKSKKNRTAAVEATDVAQQAAALIAEAQTDVPAGPIDHHSQDASWTPPASESELQTLEAEAISTEPEVLAAIADAEVIPVESEAAVEQALAVVEAQAEAAPQPAEETVSEAPAEGVTFQSLLDAVPQDKVDMMVVAVANAIDDRESFETRKDPDNGNMQRTLKKARAEMVSKAVARVLCAANVDPTFVNRTIHEGNRYNVYAIGKFADVVKAIADSESGKLRNAINLAVIKSMFRFDAAGVTFNGDMARAAASDKIRVNDKAQRDCLVRHNVAQSTAPTQASSTMQALQTLGIVVAEGSSKNPTYHIQHTPMSARLKEVLAA